MILNIIQGYLGGDVVLHLIDDTVAPWVAIGGSLGGHAVTLTQTWTLQRQYLILIHKKNKEQTENISFKS